MLKLYVKLKWILIISLVYFLTAKVGLSLAFVHPSATSVWPPSGIALASLLLLGLNVWPAIFVAAFFVNLSVNFLYTPSLITAIFTAGGIALGNTMEAVIAAYLIKRFSSGAEIFVRAYDFFRFVIFGAVFSTMVSATIGVTSLSLNGLSDWSRFGAIWLTWWLGDAAGILTITPLILVWRNPSSALFSPWKWKLPESILVLLVLLIVGQFVFYGGLPEDIKNAPLEFLCIPAVMWATFRFHQYGSTVAIVILSAYAIVGTLEGYGPFAMKDSSKSLMILQTFMGVIAITTHAIASLISERAKANESLQTAHRDLEGRIKENILHSKELAKVNVDLRKEISQRERMESQLAKQTEELTRSNAELEQFAYIASHDLQEPLRMIASYLDLLRLRYYGKLDRRADEFIRYILEGTKRMQSLINDLLDYSRVGSPDQSWETVDCEFVLKKAVENLKLAVQESGASITHDLLPSVTGVPLQLTELFQNLIANSIKFRSQEPPQIHVSVIQNENEWIFSFQDNGIGIEEQYHDRIFVIFQRLQDRRKYPGNGIGLALCKKIVERHGGRIWLQSKSGEGAAFYFSIKKRPEIEDTNQRETKTALEKD